LNSKENDLIVNFFLAVGWAPERMSGRFEQVKNLLPLPRFEPRIIGYESVAPKFYLPQKI
jgi:hypothetical protein